MVAFFRVEYVSLLYNLENEWSSIMILLCDKLITRELWLLISGLARCGNSITLPLPNLVAKLAILLRSVLCGHYSAI